MYVFCVELNKVLDTKKTALRYFSAKSQTAVSSAVIIDVIQLKGEILECLIFLFISCVRPYFFSPFKTKFMKKEHANLFFFLCLAHVKMLRPTKYSAHARE